MDSKPILTTNLQDIIVCKHLKLLAQALSDILYFSAA